MTPTWGGPVAPVPPAVRASMCVHGAHEHRGPGTKNRNTEETSLKRGMKAAGRVVRQSRPQRKMGSSSSQPLPVSARCCSRRSVGDPGFGSRVGCPGAGGVLVVCPPGDWLQGWEMHSYFTLCSCLVS